MLNLRRGILGLSPCLWYCQPFNPPGSWKPHQDLIEKKEHCSLYQNKWLSNAPSLHLTFPFPLPHCPQLLQIPKAFQSNWFCISLFHFHPRQLVNLWESPTFRMSHFALIGIDLLQYPLQKDKSKPLEVMWVDCHSVFKQNTEESCLKPWHSENSLVQTKSPLWRGEWFPHSERWHGLWWKEHVKFMDLVPDEWRKNEFN